MFSILSLQITKGLIRKLLYYNVFPLLFVHQQIVNLVSSGFLGFLGFEKPENQKPGNLH